MRKMILSGLILCLCVGMMLPTSTLAQEKPSAKDLAQANNPLAQASAFNLQNYYSPSLQGLPDETMNTFWFRYVFPAGRTVTRASLPLAKRPTGDTTSVSGLGDLNVFTAYLLVADPTTSIGIGPLVVAPSATETALGQGKWQLGLAAVAFKVTKVIQYGGLLTWQASVAGEDDRPSTSTLIAQPFGVFQLGDGTYLRSTGIWTFDLKSSDYSVPFGLGIGKVFKAEGAVFNLFIEPQFTILSEGTGQPTYQVFTGINIQFPK